MLDLNFISADSTNDEDETMVENLPDGSGGQVDDSGTSNSLVVNAEASSNGGDDDSCSIRVRHIGGGNDLFDFGFDLLKKRSDGIDTVEVDDDDDGDEAENGNPTTRSGFITRQLFPMSTEAVPPGDAGFCSGSSSSSSSRMHWVDLSFCQADMGNQLKKKKAVPLPALEKRGAVVLPSLLFVQKIEKKSEDSKLI